MNKFDALFLEYLYSLDTFQKMCLEIKNISPVKTDLAWTYLGDFFGYVIRRIPNFNVEELHRKWDVVETRMKYLKAVDGVIKRLEEAGYIKTTDFCLTILDPTDMIRKKNERN